MPGNETLSKPLPSPPGQTWDNHPFWQTVQSVQKQIGKAQEAVRKRSPEIASWIPYTTPGLAASTGAATVADNAAALLREASLASREFAKLRNEIPEGRFVTFPGAPRVSYNVDAFRSSHPIRRTLEEFLQPSYNQLEPIRTQVEGILQRAGKELNIPWTSIPVVIGGLQPHTELFDRWRPASIWDLYRRWQYIKSTPPGVLPSWYPYPVYHVSSTRVSMPGYRPEILAHELGHYADLYWKKGPYKWVPHPRHLTLRKYQNVPFSDELAQEIAATLFARKILSPEEWQKGREWLEAGLATYIDTPGYRPTSWPEEFRPSPLIRQHVLKRWRPYLESALRRRDRASLRRLFSTMLAERDARTPDAPIAVMRRAAAVDMPPVTWGPGAFPEFRELVRTLLDEEYRRMYENAADK